MAVNTGLISLDEEKASERVECSFLWWSMRDLGLVPGVIMKIQLLDSRSKSVLGVCYAFFVLPGTFHA